MNIKLPNNDVVKIANSDDVFGIMQRILKRDNRLDREKEHFWLVGLNSANRLLFVELVSMGSVKSTTVAPMNVFRMSLIKGAVKVILVHNHPSGSVKPSDNDLDLTDRLIQVGKIIDVEVIEHLIISEEGYLSFVDEGLMAELKESIRWVPNYILVEKIRREEAELRKQALKDAAEAGEKKGIKKGEKIGREKGVAEGKKQGEKEKAVEMAKVMKQNNEPIDKIMAYTGLSRKEIEKIADK